MATSFASARTKAQTITPPAPEPLGRRVDAAKPYPVDALGDVLAPFVRAVTNIIQAPEALVAQSVLAATAHAAQGHVNVEIDGRTYPVSLYLLAIAESGERKTAVDSESTRAHTERQEESWANYARGWTRYMDRVNGYAKDREVILRTERDVQMRETQVAALEEPGPPPLSPLLILDEPTYEGIYKHFFAQPSLGLFSNEGGQFVGGYAMSENQSMKTLGALNKLWDGKAINRSRSTDGTSVQFGKRLSLHLMLQPLVAHTLLSHRHAHGMGFLARCLVTYPTSTMGLRLYKEANLREDAATLTYMKCLRALLDQQLPLKEGTNDLEPRSLSVGRKAKQAWIAFHDDIERGLAAGQRYESIRAFAGKAAEQALRIAGVLTILDKVDAKGIPPEAMEAAITLTQYYVEEWIRLCGASEEAPDIALAKKLHAWIEQKKYQHIYLSQVYQSGPYGIRDRATALRVIAVLETHHILTRVPQGMELDGKSRVDVWELHRA